MKTIASARLFVALSAIPLGLANRASGQTTPSKDETVQLEKFTVTGSNIRMTTAEADRSALPVEFVTEARFKLTSGESVPDLLRNQPVVVGNVTSQYNDNSSSSQGGISGVNLRGIGEKYTLVVIDGRRIGGEGQPDVGTIPSEAMSSVEILKSGSSAIFGSDAVSGVVNMKLKDRFNGVELVTSYGNTTNKDAAFKRAALIFGLHEGRLSFVGSIATEDRAGIDKWDRDLTASRDYRRWGGIDRRTTTRGIVNRIVLPGNLLRVVDRSRFSPGQTGRTTADYIVFDPNVESYSNNEVGVAPGYQRSNGHWNASYDLLGKRLVAFATGFWDDHKQEFRVKEARANITVPANNPYNPFGAAVMVDYLMGEVLPVRELWNTTVTQSIFGLRGEVDKFDYSVATSRYSSLGHESWVGDFPITLLTAAAARTDATAFNPFGYWANSDAQLAGLSVTKHYNQRTTTDIVDAKLGGPLFALPAGDTRFAVGGEQRKIRTSADPDNAWQTMPTTIFNDVRRPTSGKRKVNAYFGEVRVPVYRGADSAVINAFELAGAARKEKYSDFGSATVGQANLRISTFANALVLRASWAEAFKAPTVGNLSAQQVTTTPSGLFDPGRNAVGVINLITGGNPTLKPEKANTGNIGAIFSPRRISGLTLRVDYWQINVTDIIATPNAQAILNGVSPGGRIVSRDPVTRVPTIDARLSNGGDINVEGLDIGGSYTWRSSSLGKLTLDLTTSYGLKFENVAGPTTFDFLGDYSATYGPIPRLRAVLGALWEKGGWSTGLFVHYTGGVRETALPPPLAPTRVTEDTWTADLQLRYNFGENTRALGGLLRNVRAYVGVENLWDEKLVFLAGGASGWDRSLGDLRGRYVYGGVRKKF